MKRSTAISTRFLTYATFAVASISHSTGRAIAAFDVTFWNLRTGVQTLNGPLEQDFETITQISNRLSYVSISSMNGGLDRAEADYNYSWLLTEPSAMFNTSLIQTFRSPRVREVSQAIIRFQTTEDAEFRLDSFLSYAHTPGDEFALDWNIRLFNQTTQFTYINTDFEGGNGHTSPSTGSFSVNETYFLPANSLFSFNYTLDSENLADVAPTGTMDISGFVNWSIVAEPATAALLAPAAFMLFGRRRGRNQRPG